MNVLAFPRSRVTREEHRERMAAAEEMLFKEGWQATHAARLLASRYGCSVSQAMRYVKAVRKLYEQSAAASGAGSVAEMITLLQAKAALCVQGDEPDWKASAKFLELAARLQGWLDRRSTVTVQGTIGLQPLPALDGASDEEIALLAQYHDARAKRLAAAAEEQPAVVGELPALAGRDD